MGTWNFANETSDSSMGGRTDIPFDVDDPDIIELDDGDDFGFSEFFASDKEDKVAPGGDLDFMSMAMKNRRGIKTKYSDSDKARMLAEFNDSYVNDFGASDPYHTEPNKIATKLQEILRGADLRHSYKSYQVADYVYAMRKVIAAIDMLYVEEKRDMLGMTIDDFRLCFRYGEINRQGIVFPVLQRRQKYPDTLLAEYIFDETRDPSELKRHKNDIKIPFDVAADDEDHDDQYVAALPTHIHNKIVDVRAYSKTKLKKCDKWTKGFIKTNAEYVTKMENGIRTSYGSYTYDANNRIDLNEIRDDLLEYQTFGTLSTKKGFEHNQKMLALQKSANKDPNYPNVERFIIQSESLGFPVKQALDNYSDFKLGVFRVIVDGREERYDVSTHKKVKNDALERSSAVYKAESARMMQHILILNASPAFRKQVMKGVRLAKNPDAVEDDDDDE